MANSGATDRELAMAVAQKRMEWLRSIPFTVTTRSLAYSTRMGGWAPRRESPRRKLVVADLHSCHHHSNTSVVPAGQPGRGPANSQNNHYQGHSGQRGTSRWWSHFIVATFDPEFPEPTDWIERNVTRTKRGSNEGAQK